MGKRTERSSLTDAAEGEDTTQNDEQYIILYPGRNNPGSSSDRTRQAFFKVPRVGRAAPGLHSDWMDKELAKRKATYGDEINMPLLYEDYLE